MTRDAVALTFCRALIDGVNERKRPIIGFIAAHKVIQSVGQLAALDDKFRSSFNFDCFNEVIEISGKLERFDTFIFRKNIVTLR